MAYKEERKSFQNASSFWQILVLIIIFCSSPETFIDALSTTTTGGSTNNTRANKTSNSPRKEASEETAFFKKMGGLTGIFLIISSVLNVILIVAFYSALIYALRIRARYVPKYQIGLRKLRKANKNASKGPNQPGRGGKPQKSKGFWSRLRGGNEEKEERPEGVPLGEITDENEPFDAAPAVVLKREEAEPMTSLEDEVPPLFTSNSSASEKKQTDDTLSMMSLIQSQLQENYKKNREVGEAPTHPGAEFKQDTLDGNGSKSTGKVSAPSETPRETIKRIYGSKSSLYKISALVEARDRAPRSSTVILPPSKQPLFMCVSISDWLTPGVIEKFRPFKLVIQGGMKPRRDRKRVVTNAALLLLPYILSWILIILGVLFGRFAFILHSQQPKQFASVLPISSTAWTSTDSRSASPTPSQENLIGLNASYNSAMFRNMLSVPTSPFFISDSVASYADEPPAYNEVVVAISPSPQSSPIPPNDSQQYSPQPCSSKYYP
ncbi:unnamed protein product [Caenorhabditis auriculariae]|uniref:Uncharacterized protein n=1 Tax=Caenorhabditis auriculariae TaxID=2777116 RepID=A0A8S1GX67_9PELO|nr:unnamed protein product [Caenorhabditis auriculariae]